jgi:hypothetical protein
MPRAYGLRQHKQREDREWTILTGKNSRYGRGALKAPERHSPEQYVDKSERCFRISEKVRQGGTPSGAKAV